MNTDTPYLITDRLFLYMKHHPGKLIWIIWLCILIVDILLILIGNFPVSNPKVIFVNFLGGGLINHFLFFYFLPELFLKRRWITVVPLLVLVFGTYAIIKLYVLGQWSGNEIQIRAFMANEATRIFHFSVYIIAIWGFYEIVQRQEVHKKMETDLLKLQVQHKSLQLSPHFVMNFFSQFLVEIKKVSITLFDRLSRFAEILSYSYKDPESPNYLAQEIRSIKSYLDCQRFRFKERFHLIFSSNFELADCTDLPLPKWTLITLVENIFKHGNCANPNQPCLISMDLFTSHNGGAIFSLSITNDLNQTPSINPSGFGIEAVKKILSFYFPDNFQLTTSKTEKDFNLFLQITYPPNLDKNSV